MANRRLFGSAPGLWLIRVLSVLCLSSVWTLGAAQFLTALSPSTVTVGEEATLSLVFEGGAPASAPALPEIPGLQVQYVGQQSQYNIVNGQASSTVTLNYQVVPLKPGDYLIPAFSIDVEGKTLTSRPLQLKVVAGKAGDTGAQAGAGSLAFVRIMAPKTNLFVGELTPVEIQLFILAGKPLQYPEMPTEGITVGKMSEPGQTRAQVGNQVYNVFVFRQPMTPARAGQLTIGPARCNVEVQLAQRNRRRSFPSMFNLLDDLVERRQVTIQSEPLVVTASPLPTHNVPADFTGAVGTFGMQVSASPTNVSVGDPITVRIRIDGRGNLDTLSLPAPQGWDHFKLYPPSSKVETTDPLGLEGIKTFDQVVTPQLADLKELPAISFSFFDPNKRQYRTLRQAPLPIVVSPATPVNLFTPAAGGAGAGAKPTEMAHIKSRLGNPVIASVPLFMEGWFVGLQGIPIVIWLAAWIHRRSQERLLRDPRLRHRREADRAVKQGLKHLHHYAATGQSEAFFAVFFRVLQEQIGGCLNLPASGITESVVEDYLAPAGLPEDLADELRALFHFCDQARYAATPSNPEMESWLPRLETVLLRLKSFEPTNISRPL